MDHPEPDAPAVMPHRDFHLSAVLTEVAHKAPIAVPELRAALDYGDGASLEQCRACIIAAIHAMNGRPELFAQQARLSALALDMQREIERRIWEEPYTK